MFVVYKNTPTNCNSHSSLYKNIIDYNFQKYYIVHQIYSIFVPINNSYFNYYWHEKKSNEYLSFKEFKTYIINNIDKISYFTKDVHLTFNYKRNDKQFNKYFHKEQLLNTLDIEYNDNYVFKLITYNY